MTLTAGQNTVTFTVTAEDSTEKVYTVNINQGVTDDYGWKADQDLDGLIAAGHTNPYGLWSDGTTLWVANDSSTDTEDRLYAYTVATGARDSFKDVFTLNSADNNDPSGIWSNGTTIWVADFTDGKLYAYTLASQSRDASKDFSTLDADNGAPQDIWSNGTTMWVLDNSDNKIYAYRMSDRSRDASQDFDDLSANDVPNGIWSNGETMWVSDSVADKLFAYDMATKARVSTQDYTTPADAGNSRPTGLTGHGLTMWVSDRAEDKVFSYNRVVSSNATLSALTVSPKDIIGFDPDRASYEVGVAGNVTQATVIATPANVAGSLEITPTDADSGADGHQVNLSAGQNAVTIEVTAEDGMATETYTVNINRGVFTPTGWKASDDFDGLIAAGNEDIYAIWANSTTLWVNDNIDNTIYAYNIATKARNPSEDFTNLSDAGNNAATGIWSDGTTMWVSDLADDKIYAYNMATKALDAGKNFNTLATANEHPQNIWSDGTTMWVLDDSDDKVYAYQMSDKANDPDEEFNTLIAANNELPSGMTSDGATMWVADSDDDKIYAYNMATKARNSDNDFDTLTGAGNTFPFGIFTNRSTMWVGDSADNKIYSYNGAISSDATLSALTVSPKDIIGFDPERAHYQVGFPSTVSRATVTATANHPLSSFEMEPPDSDSGTDGHQVNLSSGRNPLSIRVTAEDGTIKTYTVSLNQGVTTNYGWKAVDDFDNLIHEGNEHPAGLWSNGTTLWVLDSFDNNIYAYRLADGSRDTTGDIPLHSEHIEPYGIWSNETTMWVSDPRRAKIYAYSLATKARDPSKDFDTLTAAQNESPLGIWSDGATMWVADNSDDKLYAYKMSDKQRDSSNDFNTLNASGNDDPRGIWSDGAYMWVINGANDRIYAYQMTDKSYDSTKDYTTHVHTLEPSPRGIWSDGTTTWVSDTATAHNKIYSYNHPASNNADLKTLAVNSIEVSGFNPATTTYSMTVPDATREITIAAEVLQFQAEITSITPPDADSGADGHQVTIDAAITSVVVSVTAQNGAVKAYWLTVNNDSLTEPPTILSAPDGSVDENATPGQIVSTITAVDPEGATPLTFTLSQSDRASFSLVPQPDGTSAQLRTKVTFDHEAMRSGVTVVILVSDPGGAKTNTTVRVSINNIDEAGTVTIDPEPAALESELIATIDDPDQNPINITWTWYRGDTAAGPWGSPISGATSGTYTPVAADVGKYLRAVASYTDLQGPGKTAEDVIIRGRSGILRPDGHLHPGTPRVRRLRHQHGRTAAHRPASQRKHRVRLGHRLVPGSTWKRTRSTASTPWAHPPRMETSTTHAWSASTASTNAPGPSTRSRTTGSSTTPTTKCTPSGTISPPATPPPQHSYNDDGGEGLNARMYIRGFPAGTHYIEVTTVPHQEDPADEMGSYTLTLTELEDDSSSDRTVTVGTTTSGEIEYPGDTDTFVVSLDAGTEYSVQQILTGYWSGSHLINPKVENIHADPNAVVGTTYDQDADADRFTTTTAGNYRITIAGYTRSHQRFATGTYTVQVSTVSSGSSSPLPNSPPVGVPTISGTAEYGETLTADASGVTDPDGIDRSTLAYQWLRNPGKGRAAISGATSRTYTVVADDEENQLSVRVSFTDNADNAESVTSAEIYIQAPPPLRQRLTTHPPATTARIRPSPWNSTSTPSQASAGETSRTTC